MMQKIIYMMMWLAFCGVFLPSNHISAQDIQGVMDMAWSPNGQWLAVSGTTGLSIYDENLTFVQQVTDQNTESIAWRADSQQIAAFVFFSGTRIQIWDINQPAIPMLVQTIPWDPNTEVPELDWNPTTNQLVASGIISTLFDPVTGLQTGEIDLSSDPLAPNVSFAWSPNGSKAIISEGGGVSIWNTSTNTVEQSFGQGGEGFAVAWSPDGTQIAFDTREGSIQVWTLTTQEVRTLTNNPSRIQELHWVGDILTVSNNSDGLEVWNTGTWELVTMIGGRGDGTAKVAIHPGGQHIAYSNRTFNREIQMFRLTSNSD